MQNLNACVRRELNHRSLNALFERSQCVYSEIYFNIDNCLVYIYMIENNYKYYMHCRVDLNQNYWHLSSSKLT